MQDLAQWLERLGMSEYAQRFAENRIDLSVLPELTEQHLKDLGIPLGDRLKMLRAIREPIDTVPGSRPPALTEVKRQESAERRHVTVMFSDLVGSTALAARMDPEDLREVISAYQKCVSGTVERFGGFVAKYMGDGVLVYFGYPQAHEDDAERAVRAGLEVVAAVGRLKSQAALQTRVGIATGLVVVGDLIGAGESQERGIVGETPNLAARLQAVAEPNAVVIAESTRKLLGSLFELEDLGPRDIKGIAEPVWAWAALRTSSAEGRFEALHAGGLTALVGREEELELLLRRWARAKTGEGQVVLLSGEAGIGKSRLTAALLQTIASEPHIRLRYFCSPQHTDSALYPVISQMERAAGFVHDDTAQAKLDKLGSVLAQTSTSKQDAALFADMLSLPNDGSYPTLELTAEQRRQKTLEALISQVGALARQIPVLMIFEDAHWADPTSLELFGRTVDRAPSLRVLLIVTFRPEFEPPWLRRSYITTLTLNRLGERDIGAMIERVVGNKSLPASIRHEIVERTDGIPLFVEEMTKAVLEAGNEVAAQRTTAAIPSPSLAVPASLQASLMARLDRLGPAKEIAQIGAAIGREFSHALLAAVVPKQEAELGSALDRLVAAGLLFRQGVVPHATYLFKHALVQDTAYGTLLRDPRRALHFRIAEALETQFPEVAEGQPEILARHYTEAGLIEKAAHLWGKAGHRSLTRSALVEAAEQLTRALAQFAMLPGTPDLRREEIKIQVGLANSLMHTKGYAAPETKTALDRAHTLIERADALGEPSQDPLLLFSVLYGFWAANYVAGNDVCHDLAVHFLTVAEKQEAATPRMVAHRIMGHTLLCAGELAKARTHYDSGIALYEPAVHRPLATRFGHDTATAILSFRSLALWHLGYPGAAIKDINDSLEYARNTSQAASLLFALYNAPILHTLCGNYSIARAHSEELLALAGEKGSLLWKSSGMMAEGSVMAFTGKPSDAVRTLTAGLSGYQSTGARLFITWYLSNLARAHAELDQSSDAWRRIEEAITAIETTKERLWQAEIYRAAGIVALKSPEHDAAKAEALFERALAVARQQQAKSLELRAAMSMARLWRNQGKHDAARELLAPVYGWFTEGFDTLDLKEAKALLDENGLTS
jgi:class 3 adenylate cyclase/predicted ATPase